MKLTISVFLTVLIGVAVCSVNVQGADADQYVYYGYVPISTDVGWPSALPARNINDIIDGETLNYTSPEGTALLDIIAIKDGTKVQIWDILAREMLDSKTVNRLEKWTAFIKFGTFFKLVSTERVAVFLSGGYCMWAGFHENRIGTTVFYPSSEAGFIGNDFVFVSSMCSNTYISYRAGFNFYVAPLENSDIEVVSSSGKNVLRASLDQYSVGKYYLNCRIGVEQPTFGGGGDSMIFHMKSTGKLMATCVTSRSFMAVPAVTGGFVGKLFYAPVYISIEQDGAASAFIVVPSEPGEVTVYDSKLNVVDEKAFTQADVDDKAYWFKNMASAKGMLIFKSTGDMTVMVGCTYLGEGPTYVQRQPGPEDLGDDVTFLGARADQLVHFYVPFSAVLFSPRDCSATIDGETKDLKEDEFVLLDQGVHSVKADREVIIQVLSMGHPEHLRFTDPMDPAVVIAEGDYFWLDWGSYLVSVEDVNVALEAPEGFGEAAAGGMDMTMIITAVVAAGALAAVGLFVIKRRKRA